MNGPKFFHRASIKRKQVLIIMMITTVALVLACAGFTAYEILTVRAATVGNLSTLARIIGNSTGGALDFNDPKVAEDALNALAAEPHIVGACVYSADGNLFAAYGPGFHPPPQVPALGHAFRGADLALSAPIICKGETLGTIYLVSDMRALSSRLWQYAIIITLVFILTLAVALFLSGRLQKFVSDPILRLARAARDVGREKNYSIRVAGQNPDEIGILIDGFNDMLTQIQERDANLERRVAERTEQLEREIAERERTQVELARERDLLRILMENTTDLIYFKDRDSRITECSKSYYERLGVSRLEVLGRTDADFQTVECHRKFFEDEQAIIRTGKPVLGTVERNVTNDGRVTWFLTSKMPLRDKTGAIVGTFGISKDVTAIKEAEDNLEKLHRQFMDASRKAGMAEVATGVLHNVGNVLNSVNVSATVVQESVTNSKIKNVGRVADLLREHSANLPEFFASDPKGKQISPYLDRLSAELNHEHQELTAEVQSIRKNIEHIRDIVMMQQNYAKYSGMVERVNPVELIEDALRMNDAALARHDIHVVRDFGAQAAPITADKHKILQILVNLIRNAKYACDESGRQDKTVTVELRNGGDRVRFSVVDNGVGIPAENKGRIFNHGFTTRPGGHGFGLHSGALAAREMGGTLTAHSEGPGAGARFVLDLPVQTPAPNERV